MITPASVAEVGASRRALLKEAKAEQAAEEAEAEEKELRPLPGSTTKPTRRRNRRPVEAPAPSGGPRTYYQPDGVASWPWVGWVQEAPNPVVGIFTAARIFDSTRGFPGEGPTGSAPAPWFLADSSTATLRDRKPPTARTANSPSRGYPWSARPALGLVGTTARTRSLVGTTEAAKPNTTPVPQEHLPQVTVFSTPREQRDFLNPLPFVSAARSLRQEFIKHFGGLRGTDPASFDEIWKATKNGYNKAFDPHFQRFRADFLTHSPSIRFNPTGIQPGDLVGFLRREHERGVAHPTLKDASASVSSACAQASDGSAQLGSQASVIAFLKMVKQHEAPDRRERMIVYPDVARLIQIAWEFGPNGNISLEQLKRKLVILLLVNTAARPSDIWRLNCTVVGKYRQIEFLGKSNVKIRYYWPKEVDPFSSRTNATNVWFSQWVVIRGTVPTSTDTVACLREFMQRSADPEQFAPEYIPQLATSAQPLIFAKTKAGVRLKCSVDHISNIAKKAIAAANITTMKPRHLRGASTSKIVLLSPDATVVAMGLGRWTTAKTFLQHYNAPVDLMTRAPRPDSISLHGQQLLRWGWIPTPPLKVTAEEYDEPFDFWVGKTIPHLGRISAFENERYSVKRRQVTHCELMGLQSKARGGDRLSI
jgi:hypothetical protein